MSNLSDEEINKLISELPPEALTPAAAKIVEDIKKDVEAGKAEEAGTSAVVPPATPEVAGPSETVSPEAATAATAAAATATSSTEMSSTTGGTYKKRRNRRRQTNKRKRRQSKKRKQKRI
jgi:gamma-glutamyl:cysteine ligase YbdK (ATP-grasp superfamily)